jgi:hypothetical protein
LACHVRGESLALGHGFHNTIPNQILDIVSRR